MRFICYTIRFSRMIIRCDFMEVRKDFVMKRFCKLSSFIACIMISFGLFISASLTVHAASSSLSASANSVSAGSTITYTVNVSGADSATSAAVVVSYGSKFELVSGEWLKSGLADFDTGAKKGALAFTSAGSMNGSLFRLTLRAKSYDASAQSVSVNVQIKNGGAQILNQTVSASTKITCASHSYGGWSGISSATCTTGGKEQRSCSVCGALETRDTSALGHSFGAYSETKAPTCTANGTQSRNCSRCNQSENKSIAATGHDFGEWKETVAPTYGENGVESSNCKTCHAEEKREVESLGYRFSEPTSAKESVLVYYDVTAQTYADCLAKNGYVNVQFAVPEGEGASVILYYVLESGALEEVTSLLSEDRNVIETRITKLGTYAVGKVLDSETEIQVSDIPKGVSSDADAEKKTSGIQHTLTWILVAVLALALIMENVVIIRRKKKL